VANLSSEHRDGRSWEVSRRSRELPLTDSGIQCGPAKDGRILGGDALFYCLGSYSSADGRWKGEMLNQEHTPAKGENPVLGGNEVGIGFSGTCTADSSEFECIALPANAACGWQPRSS
jgi:hypothetical protein